MLADAVAYEACPDYLSLRSSETLRCMTAIGLIGLWIVCTACASNWYARVSAFAMIAMMLIVNAAASQFSGCFVGFGPWNMFSRFGGLHTLSLNGAGTCVAIALALLVTFVFFRRGGHELVACRFAPGQPPSSLALVRILMPFVLIFFDYHLGYAISEGRKGVPFPLLGVAPWLRFVPLVACVTLLIGVQARLSSLLLGTFFVLAMGDHSFWHHYINVSSILLAILAFTPCDTLFSVDSVLLPLLSQKTKRGIRRESVITKNCKFTKADAETSKYVLDDTPVITCAKLQVGVRCNVNQDDIVIHSSETSAGSQENETPKMECSWAKPLITLHLSLVYLGAGCDKVRSPWLNGTILRKVILARKALLPLFWFLFPNEKVQLVLCSIATVACIAVELLLPFLLWSKKYNILGVCLGFAMHLSMSFFCGDLGAYTMLSQVMLIATLDDDLVNSYMNKPRNFSIGALGILLLMGWTNIIEIWDTPPGWTTGNLMWDFLFISGYFVLAVGLLSICYGSEGLCLHGAVKKLRKEDFDTPLLGA